MVISRFINLLPHNAARILLSYELHFISSAMRWEMWRDNQIHGILKLFKTCYGSRRKGGIRYEPRVKINDKSDLSFEILSCSCPILYSYV